jgi:hypothetical protein
MFNDIIISPEVLKSSQVLLNRKRIICQQITNLIQKESDEGKTFVVISLESIFRLYSFIDLLTVSAIQMINENNPLKMELKKEVLFVLNEFETHGYKITEKPNNIWLIHW